MTSMEWLGTPGSAANQPFPRCSQVCVVKDLVDEIVRFGPLRRYFRLQASIHSLVVRFTLTSSLRRLSKSGM